MTGQVADPRVPCPRCGEGIRAGARKCPHCRRYLDPQLQADRAMQRHAQGEHAVDVEQLQSEVRSAALTAAVGTIVFCFVGALAGPASLGYALWYHQRARRLELEGLPWLRLLYGFSGAWTVTGAVTAMAFWWYVVARR